MSACWVHCVHAGDVVFRQGDIGDVLYFVGAGRLEVRLYNHEADNDDDVISARKHDKPQHGRHHAAGEQLQDKEAVGGGRQYEEQLPQNICGAGKLLAGGLPSVLNNSCACDEVCSGASTPVPSEVGGFYAGGATPRQRSFTDPRYEAEACATAAAMATGAAMATAATQEATAAPGGSGEGDEGSGGSRGGRGERARDSEQDGGAHPHSNSNSSRRRSSSPLVRRPRSRSKPGVNGLSRAWKRVNRLSGRYKKLGYLTAGQHFG